MGIRYNIYIKMRSIAKIFFRPSCPLFHGIVPIQGSQVRNHWMAPSSTQHFIPLRSIK